jgi:hypothetical protein
MLNNENRKQTLETPISLVKEGKINPINAMTNHSVNTARLIPLSEVISAQTIFSID